MERGLDVIFINSVTEKILTTCLSERIDTEKSNVIKRQKTNLPIIFWLVTYPYICCDKNMTFSTSSTVQLKNSSTDSNKAYFYRTWSTKSFVKSNYVDLLNGEIEERIWNFQTAIVQIERRAVFNVIHPKAFCIVFVLWMFYCAV